MVLYLTGSIDPIGKKGGITSQNIPGNSLGGFVSSTPVPNGNLNVLFGLISNMTLRENKPETFGIGLINGLGKDLKNVTMKIITRKDNIAHFEVAIVPLSGEYSMEKIANRHDQPQIADFYNLDFVPASVECKILTPALPGEDFVLQPFNVVVDGDSIQNQSVEDTMNAIEDVMQYEAEYGFRKVDNDTFEIFSKLDTPTEPVKPDYTTTGGLNLKFSGDFKMGANNTQTIADDLPSNGGVGIWIKRSIKAEYARPTSYDKLYEYYDTGKVKEDSEKIKIVIEYQEVEPTPPQV